MMKLAIIFLPILFAVIWAAFIGLRINKVETRAVSYTHRFFANFLAYSLFFRKYAYIGSNLL